MAGEGECWIVDYLDILDRLYGQLRKLGEGALRDWNVIVRVGVNIECPK